MATIRLVPSTIYNAAGTSYIQITNESNAYTDTDSTTYATIYNRNTSTSSRYVYIRGFNFDDVPSAAVVTSFTIKMKGYETGISTSTSYQPYLANGTSAINGSCSPFTTSTTTRTFSGISADWETIKGYGNNFGIRLNCRRASRNTAGYIYLYGAEIEVEYTVPDPRTITTTLSGNGTISPSGSTTTYDGEEYELTITPTNKSDTVTATKNGTDITSQLVAHGVGDTLTFTATDVELTDIQSGSSYAEYAVGHTAENPYSSSSNMYASDTGYADYSFNFSSIPSNAVIEDIEVKCYGHRESSTIDSSHISRVTLYRGSTAISESEEFQSTSSATVTLVPTTMPTRAELDSVVVRHLVGYYGGLVTGISFVVTYSTGSGIDHYTYTYTVDGDATIAVTIGSISQPKIFLKVNGSWTQYSKVYLKVNGTWVEQNASTWSTLFDTGTNYRKMN